MDIIIDIANAPKQKEIIENIDKSYCKIKDTQVTIVGIYNEDKRVHDVYRYNLIITNNSNYKLEKLDLDKDCKFFEQSRFNDYNVNKIYKNYKIIVLILESPHKDEYTDSFDPIAPAQGTTGDRINKYLCNILLKNKCEIEKDIYNVIICNPVQFQASLYTLHDQALSSKNTAVGAIRDKVWKAIFDKEKNNFQQRLVKYNPTIIINACTAKLKSSVTDMIKKEFNCILYESSKHPCIWSDTITLDSPPWNKGG